MLVNTSGTRSSFMRISNAASGTREEKAAIMANRLTGADKLSLKPPM